MISTGHLTISSYHNEEDKSPLLHQGLTAMME